MLVKVESKNKKHFCPGHSFDFADFDSGTIDSPTPVKIGTDMFFLEPDCKEVTSNLEQYNGLVKNKEACISTLHGPMAADGV